MAHIPTIGAVGIVNKLMVSVAREIGTSWVAKDEMKKLQNTLEIILAKIVDAELKQEKNIELILWLKGLKDIAYEADDIFDSLSYEAMRRQHEKGSMENKALDFVSSSNELAFRLSIAKKLKDISKRLDVVAKDMGRFHLQTTPSQQLGRQTISSADASDTFQREDDKYEIVKILTAANTSSSTSLDDPNQNHEKVDVISVVGVGGVGKTQLAQLVYDDPLVTEYFDLRIWVCVPEDFDLKGILIKFLESIAQNKEFSSISDVEVLAETVREKLTEKKYLLVLDDLRNEDAERWEGLRNLLAVGAQGSKVLITTRRFQVADVVNGSIPPYQLKHSEDDECWSIIARKAFSHGGARKTPKMTNIGREIAKRCVGLPLVAAKVLGSLMYSKTEEGDWLSIQENDMWSLPRSQHTAISVLILCYNNLPSHLKQCFSYCAMFPKNSEIDRETLIQLWMAEGFLESPVQPNRSIEDVGNEYFQSLLESSFLEGVTKNFLKEVTKWKMHDLVHNLAGVVGDGECVSLKVSQLNNVFEVRRLDLTMDEDLSATSAETLSNMEKLRTLIVRSPLYTLNLERLSSNMHLRVLSLGHAGGHCSGITFSDSELRHLKYLNLFAMNFRAATTVAESIPKFYSLQTLVLKRCVHVQNLLRNIESLRVLRNLDISFTDIEELPDSVTSLCSLHRLDLSNCRRLTSFPNSATGLKYLTYLDMSFTPIEDLPGFISSLHNLQTLDLTNCSRLRAIPEYVTSFKYLRVFHFSDCPLLDSLPKNFEALTQLRSFNLAGTEINVLPDSCLSLINLEFLNLHLCELPKEVKYWKKLREFYYSEVATPAGIGELVSLQVLMYRVQRSVEGISGSYNGIEEIGNLVCLEELVLTDVHKLKDPIPAERANLRGKPNLRTLVFNYGESVFENSWWNHSSAVLEALQPPSNLGTLRFVNFRGEEIPTWLCVSNLPNLEQLELRNCKIKRLPASFGQFRLEFLELTGMSLKSFDIMLPAVYQIELIDILKLEEMCCLCPKLQSLQIINCIKLRKIPSFPSLQRLFLKESHFSIADSLTSLTSLRLEDVDGLVYFPISVLRNNPNLQILSFKGCRSFRGFEPDNTCTDEVALYGSVQSLALIDCPDLLLLPDLRQWISLGKLIIYDCFKFWENLTYDLKSLPSLKELYADGLQWAELGEDLYNVDGVEDLINLLQ